MPRGVTMTLPPFWPGYNHTLLALPPKTAESWPNFGVIGVVSGDFPPLLLSANIESEKDEVYAKEQSV